MEGEEVFMERNLQEKLTYCQQENFALDYTSYNCNIIIMHIGERIKEARDKIGISQSELARRIGVKPQAVQAWEALKNGPTRKRIQLIAKELNISPQWLEFGSEASSPLTLLEGKSSQKEPTTHIHPSQLKQIPVVGTTQGGPDRHWEELGYPTGWGDEYAVIESDDPHAYLLRVEGDSMSPRINAGEYVLVEPSFEAKPGDIVVAKLTSGEVMLKYFRADYGEEVALESHNHGFTLKTVRKSEIVFMHQVSGTLFRRKIKKRV